MEPPGVGNASQRGNGAGDTPLGCTLAIAGIDSCCWPVVATRPPLGGTLVRYAEFAGSADPGDIGD